MKCYPLKFSTHVRSYSFGGRRLVDEYGKRDLPEGIVAETWEISDYKETTGTVTNGEYAGKTLRELVQQFPDELVGRGWRGPHFPLLEKFLDANKMLPVHLHADDDTAKCKYCEPNGKTEAWHILSAAPGATILIGAHTHNHTQLFNAFKRQDYDSVIPRLPIKAGDTVYVPAGVLHSFGPDTVVFEVQQTSDLAQSVMPSDVYGTNHHPEAWEKNIKETLDELRPHPNPKPHAGLVRNVGQNQITVGCAGPYFVLERWALMEPHPEPAHEHRCMTITGIHGNVTVEYSGGTETLQKGVSCVVPAALGEFRIVPQAPDSQVIACYVPNLDEDVRKPLRNAGYKHEQISQLGQL